MKSLNKWAVGFTTIVLASSLGASSVLADGHHGHRHLTREWNQSDEQTVTNIDVAFIDLGNYGWARNAIAHLTKRGIFHGIGNQRFNPEGNLTRGQLAAVLSRYFGQTATTFDVNYSTDAYMSRAETIQCIMQNLVNSGTMPLLSADQANEILSQYQDADDIPPSYRQCVATAIHHHIISGLGANTFGPLGTLTRAQIAAILYNIESLQGQNTTVYTNGYYNAGSTEVAPGYGVGTPSYTTTSSIINETGNIVTVGQNINIQGNAIGTVYLIQNNQVTTITKAALDQCVSAGYGTYANIPQVGSTISLSTNLPVGTYTLYFADTNGNLSVASNGVQLENSTPTYNNGITNVSMGNQYVDANGNTQVAVNVGTSGIPDGTTVGVELINNSDGSSLPSVVYDSATLVNNNATVNLTVPAWVSSGSYRLYVRVGDYVNQNTVFTK